MGPPRLVARIADLVSDADAGVVELLDTVRRITDAHSVFGAVLARVGSGRSGFGTVRISLFVADGLARAGGRAGTGGACVIHLIAQLRAFRFHVTSPDWLKGHLSLKTITILHPTGKLVKWYILEIENAVTDGVPGVQLA
jgi:hypothetical protein